MLTIMSNHYLEVAWLNGQLQRMVVVLQLLAANLKRYGLALAGFETDFSKPFSSFTGRELVA